ncbi:MAG: hypothetical protein HY842_18800, partial [Bacteroidetes bacterium]|nr:hypothetical protein [Bacteroidota bacterium]
DDDNDGVNDDNDVDDFNKNSDSDGDGITDDVETGGDASYNAGVDSNPLDTDTDDDGLADGLEDSNQNGSVDEGETDPSSNDSDDDGLLDNEEDANLNGQMDPGESDPTNPDDDNDGILTVDEDTNGSGDVTDDDTDLDGIPDYMDPDPFVFVSMKAFLQGPFVASAGMMHDSLRVTLNGNGSRYVPLTEPYTNLTLLGGHPFVHLGGGGETIHPNILNVTGPNAIVDWVFLELRSKSDPTYEVFTRAALLQRDGDIVDLDGVSPVVFRAKTDDYYIALRHRNHLGVMTAAPISLTRDKPNAVYIDFSSPSTLTWGTNSQKTVGSVNVLWAGNADANSVLIYQGANADRDFIFFDVFLDEENPNGSFNHIGHGYRNSDTNMDGKFIYQGIGNDVDNMIFFNVLFYPGNVGSVINYIVNQQLP